MTSHLWRHQKEGPKGVVKRRKIKNSFQRSSSQIASDAHCSFFCSFLALMVAEAMADGFGHNHRNAPRSGRRGFSSRQGRRGFPRRGRQEDPALGNYGAATEAPEVLPPPDYDYAADAAPLGSYGADDASALGQYAAGDAAAADPNLAMLEKAVPGIPGEDYPIFAEVPESGFSCEGQVDGGKRFNLF